MFYFACLAGGCSPTQAKLLYAGVRVGAWAENHNILASAELAAARATRLPNEHTKEELAIRAKYTLIAGDLQRTPDRFDDIKRVVDSHLQQEAARN
jgi:hypothetical protein